MIGRNGPSRDGGGGVGPAADSGPRACRYAAMALLACALLTTAVWGASLDDRVYAIARQLMCPVCAGQTVAESDSSLAREMKNIIRQKLQAGETSDQILRYFVAQFGESVLAEPRPGGVSLILYAAPPLALIVGLAIAVAFIRRSRARGGSPEAAPPRA
jgi:cytochrome c-type biogenesis protein CcmH/NrfF